MGRIAAIGGHEDPLIIKHIVKLSGVEKPNMLFIATASSDNTEYYSKMALKFGEYGCDARPLYLIRRKYTKEKLDQLFSWADIIYVCGGDTVNMIRVWKTYGIDARLRDVFENDSALLCGSSAGGICWFGRGFSDSSRTPEYGKHGWVDGIGIFPDICFCPHFASRADAFRQALGDCGGAGMGLDNHTCFWYDNGKESFFRRDSFCNISVFTQDGGVLRESEPVSLNLSEYYGIAADAPEQ